MPNNTDDKYSVPAFTQKRLQQRARVAQLVMVALLAGFVGAGWGYLKGEVAVLSGQSEMASVLLSIDPATQVADTPNSGAYGDWLSATPKVTSQTTSALPTDPGYNPNDILGSKTASPEEKAAAQKEKTSCIVGGEDKCLNKCSASYVRNSSSGSVAAIDCYGKPGDKAKPLMDKLVACIEKHKGNYDEKKLKSVLCEVAKPPVVKTASGSVTTSSGGGSNSGTQPSKETALSLPHQDCVTIANEILALRGKGKKGEQKTVDCSIGASVCSEATKAPALNSISGSNQNPESGKFVCEPKPKEGQGGDTSAPKPEDDPCAKQTFEMSGCFEKKWKNFTDNFRRDANGDGSGSGARNGVTGSGAGGGMPKPPGGGSGGGSSGGGQQQPQCPQGYVLSNSPQTQSNSSVNTSGSVPVVYNSSSTTLVCVPANQANAKPPECVFNASKNNPAKGEKITLTWSTTNTDNGGRVMLGDGTNNGRIEAKGTQEVTITSARTYTLTAYNAKNETKECKVEITLGGTGESGTSGAYPPKLSCAPSIIEKGKSATVTWQCPTAAKKSAGEGTTTGGDVAGKKTVTPDHNTEYTVSCYKTETADVDDEESEDFLGKSTCSVRVAQPEFDIIAYPEDAKRGERVRISWGSLFMKTCEVTGPRGFDYTRPNGVVVTEPFSTNEATAPDRTIRAAVYTVVCESIFGKKYSSDVEVDFEN